MKLKNVEIGTTVILKVNKGLFFKKGEISEVVKVDSDDVYLNVFIKNNRLKKYLWVNCKAIKKLKEV